MKKKCNYLIWKNKKIKKEEEEDNEWERLTTEISWPQHGCMVIWTRRVVLINLSLDLSINDCWVELIINNSLSMIYLFHIDIWLTAFIRCWKKKKKREYHVRNSILLTGPIISRGELQTISRINHLSWNGPSQPSMVGPNQRPYCSSPKFANPNWIVIDWFDWLTSHFYTAQFSMLHQQLSPFLHI